MEVSVMGCLIVCNIGWVNSSSMHANRQASSLKESLECEVLDGCRVGVAFTGICSTVHSSECTNVSTSCMHVFNMAAAPQYLLSLYSKGTYNTKNRCHTYTIHRVPWDGSNFPDSNRQPYLKHLSLKRSLRTSNLKHNWDSTNWTHIYCTTGSTPKLCT